MSKLAICSLVDLTDVCLDGKSEKRKTNDPMNIFVIMRVNSLILVLSLSRNARERELSVAWHRESQNWTRE